MNRNAVTTAVERLRLASSRGRTSASGLRRSTSAKTTSRSAPAAPAATITGEAHPCSGPCTSAKTTQGHAERDAERARQVEAAAGLARAVASTPGALSATLGVTLVVFALVQGPDRGWGSPEIVAGGAAGALLLVVFALVERRSPDPLVRPRLLANRNLATAAVTAALFMATFGSLLYFLSLYFQDVMGYDALGTGIGFLLPTAFVVAGSTMAGRVATAAACGSRWSPRSPRRGRGDRARA